MRVAEPGCEPRKLGSEGHVQPGGFAASLRREVRVKTAVARAGDPRTPELFLREEPKTLGAHILGLGIGEQPGLMESLRAASGGSHALVCRTPRPCHQIRPPLFFPWRLTELSALPRNTSAF